MTDDSHCHCQTCTVMNEPLTLEGDIRYLKAHIETKDRQLADAMLRINIYKEAWRDAEKNNTILRQKLDEMHQLAMTRLNDNMGLSQENEKLQGALNNEIKHHAAKLDELDKLKADYEKLRDHYFSLEKAYCKLSDKIQSIKRTVEFL
jgi:chromosome segregation ATPase